MKTMITHSIPNGYAYTLTSKLGHILTTAEGLYGLRDSTYTILGIEFYHQTNPQVWFPGNCKHIAIQLTYGSLFNMDAGVFELAHEAIHCLTPTSGIVPATILEEGLATHFSLDYAQNNGHGNFLHVLNPKYTNALQLFTQLIAIDNNIIIKIRKIQPVISLVTDANLQQANNNIPPHLAIAITQVF